MILNTQSYMWDGSGLGWVGYLPGAVLRAPDSANNLQIVTAGCVVTALFVVFNIYSVAIELGKCLI